MASMDIVERCRRIAIGNHPDLADIVCDAAADEIVRLRETAKKLPTALTVIKRVALADGVLKGHENYMTKLEMIALCKAWLMAQSHVMARRMRQRRKLR